MDYYLPVSSISLLSHFIAFFELIVALSLSLSLTHTHSLSTVI